ncbi:hypothetical protein VB796_08620 [Arcicella sp. LKC2W]|uniref:hypothetical protein n=1 Tax=Arcicella sp. LKC2W TaxID=2984198 RepID=UPI002B1F10E3|nr:hypothetical protein [Arcicella sp. LKC2W]MEA5459097.1 hypothetical protein [Arcicella sp. LKC2W]
MKERQLRLLNEVYNQVIIGKNKVEINLLDFDHIFVSSPYGSAEQQLEKHFENLLFFTERVSPGRWTVWQNYEKKLSTPDNVDGFDYQYILECYESQKNIIHNKALKSVVASTQIEKRLYSCGFYRFIDYIYENVKDEKPYKIIDTYLYLKGSLRSNWAMNINNGYTIRNPFPDSFSMPINPI